MQLSIFVQRFFNEGPGAVGIDLDDGIKLMEQYSDQFKSLEQQRHEFGKEQHTHTPNFTPTTNRRHRRRHYQNKMKWNGMNIR